MENACHWSGLLDPILKKLPGVLLAGLVGWAAYGIGQEAQLHTQLVSDVVIAILLEIGRAHV